MFKQLLRQLAWHRSDGAAQIHLCGILSRYLHEPNSAMLQLLRKHRRYFNEVNRFRHRRQSPQVLDRHLASFQFQQRHEFDELQRHYPGSRILVSYHFGDFIYGNNLVAGCEIAGRQQYYLTQLPSSDAFLSNMHYCFGKDGFSNREQITANAVSAATLVRKLRSERCSLLTFVDLPSGFGERIRVSFLDRQAWFPKGPAVLSLASGAPILPVIHCRTGNSNHIQLFPLLEARKFHGESLLQASTRLTQSLVTILERALRRYPWQWRFLSLLPTYFECDSQEQLQENETRSHHDNGCRTSCSRYSEAATI